ncbi:MAG: thermostable hemolysin [Pseudohongiellaceae bacterium]
MTTAAMTTKVQSGQISLTTASATGINTPSGSFMLALPADPDRSEYEQFIAQRFNEAFGASLIEFFPLLLARRDADAVTSVVGLRPGDRRPLFLEQYLDSNLETAISDATGCNVDRLQLMEIGNLASVGKTGSQLLFILLTAVLAEAGFEWVVFTATEQIRLLLQRLRFEPVTLCEANPARLVNKNQVWGSYYQSHPKVQAGNVSEAVEILHCNPYSAALLKKHKEEIRKLAGDLLPARYQLEA